MDSSNSIFDTSISYDSSVLTKEQMIDELMPQLQFILDRRFPNNRLKRQIRKYKDRISFAAPCCGDSEHDNTKKRGNIILEGKYKNHYKCFNCGVFMPVTTFFAKYGGDMPLDLLNYFVNNKTDLKETVDNKGVKLIQDTAEINKLAFDRESFKRALNLEESCVRNYANAYLSKRQQYAFNNFLYNVKHQILFILNLTDEGKIFGLQTKHLEKGYKGPKYKTYNLSKIYSSIFRQEVEIDAKIDQLSMIFNILTVDCSKTVNVFEGPMDAFLMKNSIALSGAAKHINFGFKSRYFFDDDSTGLKHAKEVIEDGGEVFLWDKFKADMGLPRRPKWDLNDVIIWAKENNVVIPRLDDYFSDDPFDLLYV